MKLQTRSRAARAAEIRRQMAAADAIPAGGNWRQRAAKARLFTRLRNEEAELRRRARPDLDFDLPF